MSREQRFYAELILGKYKMGYKSERTRQGNKYTTRCVALRYTEWEA